MQYETYQTITVNKQSSAKYRAKFTSLFDQYYNCCDESLLMEFSALAHEMVIAGVPPEISVEFFLDARAKHTNNPLQNAPVESQCNLILMEIITAYGLTFRRLIEEQKQHTSDQFINVLEQCTSYIFITDRSGNVTYANPIFRSVFKKPEAPIEALPSFVNHAECNESKDLFNYLYAGKRWRGKLAVEDVKGNTRILSMTAFGTQLEDVSQASHFVFIADDISDEIVNQQRANQAKRYQALGELASGLSHEFNNVMLIISGFAELISQEPHPVKIKSYIDEIHSAIAKGQTLNKQISSFSRQEHAKPSLSDLNELMSTIKQSLSSVIGNRIKLEVDCPSQISLQLSEHHLYQMMTNLCINARHAIEASPRATDGKGLISIACACFENSPWIEISISDNGCGMNDETVAQIFEPFFTTKDVGKGTGLGLSLLQKQVNEYQGYIQVSSTIDVGTTISMFLPVAESHSNLKKTDIPAPLLNQWLKQQIR